MSEEINFGENILTAMSEGKKEYCVECNKWKHAYSTLEKKYAVLREECAEWRGSSNDYKHKLIEKTAQLKRMEKVCGGMK